MKFFVTICFLFVCIAASPIHAQEITSDVLTIEDVTPMLQSFVNLKPKQKLLSVYGISQNEVANQAKVFFQFEKVGRNGPTPTRGELNCFKLNSGKWYCGGVYDILKK
jgi:hypothetical protein